MLNASLFFIHFSEDLRGNEKEGEGVDVKKVMKKKSIKKKGALRARAASVRVTLLLRMIIEAIRTASEESQKQQRLEAQSLVYRTRARSDSRNSMSSDSGAIHSSGK